MKSHMQTIHEYYCGRIAKFGGSGWEVAGYPSHDNQYGTYVLLTQMIDKKRPGTLLDVGCGQGELYEFIDSRGMNVTYEGIDLCPPMIDYARSKFPDGKFSCRDFLEEGFERSCDYVIAANAMNVSTSPYGYVFDMAKKMFKTARRAISFNLLSDAYDGDRQPGLIYYEPAKILDICLDISPYLHLNHAQSGYDFCVYLYRNEKA